MSKIVQDHDKRLLFVWSDPWFPSVLVTVLLIVPIGLSNGIYVGRLLSAWWPILPILFHLVVSVLTARHLVGSTNLERRSSRMCTSIVCCLDILASSVLYPLIWRKMDDLFFHDIDGTVHPDWKGHHQFFVASLVLCYLVAAFRILLGIVSISVRLFSARKFGYCPFGRQHCSKAMVSLRRILERASTVRPNTEKLIRSSLRYILTGLPLAILVVFFLCLRSARLQFLPGKAPKQNSTLCDPMDPTECWLPFPSFHFLTADSTTDTGYRVSLPAEILPPWKNKRQTEFAFLNQLDGFSTLPLILWYLNGLFEGHEAGLHQLLGPDNIAESITNSSITLLLDVEMATLVPHHAELTHLEGTDPLVQLVPGSPLYHNRHYAVAVLNAKNASGNNLPPSAGMLNLINEAASFDDADRRNRYMDLVFPALLQAAPWINLGDASLQLLFDFHTVSERSQLGTVRAVRDGVVRRVSSADWDWSDHVRTIRQDDFDCRDKDVVRARRIDAEMEVPWFLESTSRFSRLNNDAVASGLSRGIGIAKFMVQIPCSLKHAALNETREGKPLRAIVDYGHGVFGTRLESQDGHLNEMANLNGYLIVAMDWRGASWYDALVLASMVVSRPWLIEVLRDNLIQGFACKYALQHFTQNALFDMEWLQFKAVDGDNAIANTETVPTLDDKPPVQVFYGFSQGGILGAGYTALSGSTGLIDRSVLVAGGTSFGYIVARSLEDTKEKRLLVTNFFGNRHVRTFLSIAQMAYDTVEASGTLALPITGNVPRTILHAGSADKAVPIASSHMLARAFSASLLPDSPRTDVFDLPIESPANGTFLGPQSTFSELIYNTDRDTHLCLREDAALIAQISEFFNTGRVTDPCTEGGCYRTGEGC